MDWRNKIVVVITGGTRGIGYAAAELFLREGACVAVCGSNEKLVAQINARAEQEALPLLAVTADITSAPQLKHLFSETERRFGRIDVLINNAGMGCPDGFLTLQDDLWAREIDVNLTAVSEACRLVLPYFRKAGSGCILSTSSLCGQDRRHRPQHLRGHKGRRQCLYQSTGAGAGAVARARQRGSPRYGGHRHGQGQPPGPGG